MSANMNASHNVRFSAAVRRFKTFTLIGDATTSKWARYRLVRITLAAGF